MKAVGEFLVITGAISGLCMLIFFILRPDLVVHFWFWCLDYNHRTLAYVPSAIPILLVIVGWTCEKVAKRRTA